MFLRPEILIQVQHCRYGKIKFPVQIYCYTCHDCDADQIRKSVREPGRVRAEMLHCEKSEQSGHGGFGYGHNIDRKQFILCPAGLDHYAVYNI